MQPCRSDSYPYISCSFSLSFVVRRRVRLCVSRHTKSLRLPSGLNAAAHFRRSFRSGPQPPAFTPGCFNITGWRVIQVFGLEHEDPAQLLLRLGIWAIGDRHFDILPLQGGGVLRALERFPNHQSNLSLEARRRMQNTHPSWHSARFRTWFPIFSNPCIQGRCISQVSPVWMVQQFVDCSLCL